jgi:hypothetical protein
MGFVRRASLLLGLSSAVFAAACGTDSQTDTNPSVELLPGFSPGPAPDYGLQLIQPPVRNIMPGESRELCTYTAIKVGDLPTTDLRKLLAHQLTGGHHVSLYSSLVSVQAGTQHDCTEADMTNFRFVAATNAEGTPQEAPGDLAFRLPANSYLAIQEHFINAGDAPIDSQSSLNIYYADPGQTYTPSGGLAFVDTNINLAPGADTLDVHCTMNRDFDGWYADPHMHNYGTRFTATLTHADTPNMIMDVEQWDSTYEFHPPEYTYSLDAPLSFKAGDTVDVHCEWNNTTSSELKFGSEMCVMYVATIDRDNVGSIACDAGWWGPF